MPQFRDAGSDVSSSDESEICFEKTSRACYDAERISDDGNQVFDCAFHPTQPMLACGLRNGSIRIFRGQHANSAFSTWEPDDRLKVDIKAHINCLAWNVIREILFCFKLYIKI